ncbi:MAG: 3-phosphoshikimate 1-carboxyvinyltransferase [Acholeplasmatales bacterium]|nr:MAG: 3-phosphoshikimate 1-carboxyvinyltransferase [Acholeplasmatales bacterium]
MDIRVYPVPLTGELRAPSSKSLSHRYLIGAALAPGISRITNILDAEDLDATRLALLSLGIRIDGDTVAGGTWEATTAPIHCGASGSTVRFLMPVAMHLDAATTFTGTGRLPKRPLDVYESLFVPRGQYVRHGIDPLPATVLGPLEPGPFKVSGSVSSQFISGLLFILPTLDGPSSILIDGPLESVPYVDLTLAVMAEFGIKVHRTQNGFDIPGYQTYRPLETAVEGDYSQAAFWLVGGAIGAGITLSGLRRDSVQGDRAVVAMLETMGADITVSDQHLTIQNTPLHAVFTDLRDTPDLGPVLMLLSGTATGTSTFTGLKRLRIKESDRLGVLQELLTRTGVPNRLDGDTLNIVGQTTLQGNQRFHTYDDHRIAMALCAMANRFDQPFIIEDIDVIRKSYPRFLDDYAMLGGRFDTL